MRSPEIMGRIVEKASQIADERLAMLVNEATQSYDKLTELTKISTGTPQAWHLGVKKPTLDTLYEASVGTLLAVNGKEIARELSKLEKDVYRA
jgi:hypothetical protein